MSPKRRTDTHHAGERAEDRARSDAKKPISVLVSGDHLTARPNVTPGERALAIRYLRRWIPDDAVRAELLEALGLAEVAA